MSERNPSPEDRDEPFIRANTEDYVRFKKDRIKEAAKKGNKNKARREAVELLQYLGVGDYEMPIERALDEVE